MDRDDPGGVTWRPLGQDDLEALFALYERWETEVDQSYRTSRAELEHEMAEPDTDLATDTLVAVDAHGALVASVWLRIRSRPGLKHRVDVMTTAIDGYGHLEIEALEWAHEEAQTRLRDANDQLPRVIRGFAETTATSKLARYESFGFEIVRYFVDMARPADANVGAETIPAGVESVAWDDRWARSTFDTEVEAFADHWGVLPPTWEEFQHRLAWPGSRLDLSFLAIADGQVVSYCLNGVYPQDFELRGRSQGWIETLGTLRAWRKQGLASALVNESIRRFATEGLEYAAIGVDAANPTGAFGLYERLGFVEETKSVALMKSIEMTGDRPAI